MRKNLTNKMTLSIIYKLHVYQYEDKKQEK